jgi:hypothetical protein
MPIKKGYGASMTSIMSDGRMGIRVCFHWKGNAKDSRAVEVWVNNDLYLETRRILRSRISLRYTWSTFSTERVLNKF